MTKPYKAFWVVAVVVVSIWSKQILFEVFISCLMRRNSQNSFRLLFMLQANPERFVLFNKHVRLCFCKANTLDQGLTSYGLSQIST
ncbi:CLUMA_CG005879, isoform A [Clunio marinus]|uniref:CLUMA_CG005879, isoform A n=1 Tax=Clunio marinus TaxID=568069 RepID=A0A1J1HWB8_9DIPT|nr:CLUMA_CG005879, isoform A [Clunio marinus]